MIHLYFLRTLEERAKRLFGTKGKTLEEIDPLLFAKAKPGKKSNKEEKDTEKHKEIALLEAQICRYAILQYTHFALKNNQN